MCYRNWDVKGQKELQRKAVCDGSLLDKFSKMLYAYIIVGKELCTAKRSAVLYTYRIYTYSIRILLSSGYVSLMLGSSLGLS